MFALLVCTNTEFTYSQRLRLIMVIMLLLQIYSQEKEWGIKYGKDGFTITKIGLTTLTIMQFIMALLLEYSIHSELGGNLRI